MVAFSFRTANRKLSRCSITLSCFQGIGSSSLGHQLTLMTVTHVMIGKCHLCHDIKQLPSNPGLKLGNAFGVSTELKLTDAFGVDTGLELANTFGVNSKLHHYPSLSCLAPALLRLPRAGATWLS